MNDWFLIRNFRYIYIFLLLVSDNLDLVSQELVKLAKDKGSTDNITVVVVFLKPIEDLIKQSENYVHLENTDEDEVDTYRTNPQDQTLYEGITSTSVFITQATIMNGSSEDLVVTDLNGSNVEEKAQNPFSPMIDDFDMKPQPGAGGEITNNPFASPLMDGFSNNPFANMSGTASNLMMQQSSSEGGDSSLDGSDMIGMNLNNEQFKEAVPNMFEESKSPSMFEKPSVDDLFAKDSEASSGGGSTGVPERPLAHNNPFLPSKGDSGFISPACNSSHNQSASASEDSAENHEERRRIESAASSVEAAPINPIMEDTKESNEEDSSSDNNDDEPANNDEVSSFLSGSGGGIENQIDELMRKASRETPTPPMEENGECVCECVSRFHIKNVGKEKRREKKGGNYFRSSAATPCCSYEKSLIFLVNFFNVDLTFKVQRGREKGYNACKGEEGFSPMPGIWLCVCVYITF